MLWQRITTALIMLPVAIMAIFFLSLEVFCIVVAVIILIGCWEWSGFIGKISFLQRVLYLLLSAGIMWLIYSFSDHMTSWNSWVLSKDISELFLRREPALIAIILATIWWNVAFVLIIIFPSVSQSLIHNTLLMALTGWLILIPAWVALTGLRSIGMDVVVSDFHRGSNLLLFALCLVWAADTGAFIAGKIFGKHKLAPHVSPKKTWEGVLGGVLFATLVVFVSAKLLEIPESQFLGLTILAILVVSFSIIGDLTESIFKRLSGVKDSGHILPGHGGILDRIDGLTAATPLCLLGFALLGIN